MAYEIGYELSQHYFLVKQIREFGWGIIGTLTECQNGDISFKFGNEDMNNGRFVVGDILRVSGSIASYNDAPQVVGKCERVERTPEVIRKVVPTTNVNVEDEFTYMLAAINSVKTTYLAAITTSLLTRYQNILKELPAGIAMHHAYLGGWVEHTCGILRSAIAISRVYAGRLNPDLLVCGAILHDIGKLYEFQLNDVGLVSEYTFLGDGLGHATIGVGMIMAEAQKMGADITDPSIAALLNIVGTHAGNREWGACADPVSAEAIVISHLDNMDARINSLSSSLKDCDLGDGVYDKAAHGRVYRTTYKKSYPV